MCRREWSEVYCEWGVFQEEGLISSPMTRQLVKKQIEKQNQSPATPTPPPREAYRGCWICNFVLAAVLESKGKGKYF